MKTLYLLHGYGVRSFFWDSLKPELQRWYDVVTTPDVDALDFNGYCDEIERRIVGRREDDPAAVVLVGHSLGALVAAAVGHRLGKVAVSHVVLIAPPGKSQTKIGPVLRFLLRRRLIPDFLIRPRFFVQTPAAVRKRIFERAVVEPPGLQDDVYLRRASIVEGLAKPLPQRALVVTSDRDQIAPAFESVALAKDLGAAVHRFSTEERVGHDDYAAAPAAVSETARLIGEFAGGNG